jgi:hypothetical protein
LEWDAGINCVQVEDKAANVVCIDRDAIVLLLDAYKLLLLPLVGAFMGANKRVIASWKDSFAWFVIQLF